MHSLYLLSLLPAVDFAAVEGRCSGSATGVYKDRGICITTGLCSSYQGTYINGGCPDDGAAKSNAAILAGTQTRVVPIPTARRLVLSFAPSVSTWVSRPPLPTDIFSPSTGYCPGKADYACCDP
jgi:hypothetical protein